MTATVDWATKIISVPKADLTFISGTLYEMDTDAFRLELKGIEDSVDGMAFERITKHNTEVTVAGTTFARTIEVINGYTIQFEDGQYAVRLVGSNNNIFDEGILSRNQVSVISTNSAGLISVATGGGTGTATEEQNVHVEVTYDGTDSIKMGLWLTSKYSTIPNPTSCEVKWYSESGTLMFTKTSASPDAQGHFLLTATQALVGNTSYYVVASIVDASGTIVTHRGIPTVGT